MSVDVRGLSMLGEVKTDALVVLRNTETDRRIKHLGYRIRDNEREDEHGTNSDELADYEPTITEEESVGTTDASIGKESEKDAADDATDHVDPDNVK